MADRQYQTSGIKNYQAQVYDKTSNILAIIDAHLDANCPHCLELLKSAVGSNHSSRPTETTTQRNQLQDGTEEYES
jgi:hypothetical protein